MVDINKLVGTITGSGLAGGVAGGALVSALTTKSGRKAMGSIAKIGGLAAVGALAWKAYQGYQDSKTASPEAQSREQAQFDHLNEAQFVTIADQSESSSALTILRAMISAALADGLLTADEQSHIFSQLDRLGLSAEEKSMLFDELRNPLTAESLALQVKDPVIAVEVYTAAAMTIDAQCTIGRGYLERLASAMNLPPALVSVVEQDRGVIEAA